MWHPEPPSALARDLRSQKQRPRAPPRAVVQLRQRPLHPVAVLRGRRFGIRDRDGDRRAERRRGDHGVPAGLAVHRQARLPQNRDGGRDARVRAVRLRDGRSRHDPAGPPHLAPVAHVRPFERDLDAGPRGDRRVRIRRVRRGHLAYAVRRSDVHDDALLLHERHHPLAPQSPRLVDDRRRRRHRRSGAAHGRRATVRRQRD